MKELLLQLGDILDELKTPHFLIQGTALGAHREGKIIEWDRDIDIGILIEHFACNAGEIIKRLVQKNVAVETRGRHSPFKFCHTIVAYTDQGKADLVGFHRWEDERFTSSPVDPVHVLHPHCYVHPAEQFENYEMVTMYDRVWNVPHPVEEYLRCEYGTNWRKPNKKDYAGKSKTSNTRIFSYLDRIEKEFFDHVPQLPVTYYHE